VASVYLTAPYGTRGSANLRIEAAKKPKDNTRLVVAVSTDNALRTKCSEISQEMEQSHPQSDCSSLLLCVEGLDARQNKSICPSTRGGRKRVVSMLGERRSSFKPKRWQALWKRLLSRSAMSPVPV
jgi:hypothetical protein